MLCFKTTTTTTTWTRLCRASSRPTMTTTTMTTTRLQRRALTFTTLRAADTSSPPLVACRDNEDGILTLTLHRPVINLEMWELLHQQLEQVVVRAAAHDDDKHHQTRAVVLQADGPVHGYDWHELLGHATTTTTPDHQAHILQQATKVWQALARLPVPTLAAVPALASGAGCALAVACDLVVASPLAAFAATPPSFALPDTATVVRLRTLLGEKRCADMVLTGRAIPAKQALEWGLVTHVLGNPQRQAQRLAREVVAATTGSSNKKKEAYVHAMDDQDYQKETAAYARANAYMVQVLQSSAGQQAVQTYLDETTQQQQHDQATTTISSKHHDRFKQFSEIPSGAEMRQVYHHNNNNNNAGVGDLGR